MDAEFEALDLYRCLAVRDRVGEEFEGVVSGVAPFGLFVRLEAPFVEGMVHVSDLGEDWFEHDERRVALVGQSNGRAFRLGDALSVRIAEVDVPRRRIGLVPTATA